MKEYQAESGGRHTFTEDFTNLQDLALSYSSMFSGCGNFVISGCEWLQGATEDTITPGMVFIDGKMRSYPGAFVDSSTTEFYLVAKDYDKNVPYSTGESKLGRIEYNCEGSLDKPAVDSSKYLVIKKESRAASINDKFFGKYCLLLNPSSEAAQTVDSPVTVNGYFKAKDGVGLANDIRFYKSLGDDTVTSIPLAFLQLSDDGALRVRSNRPHGGIVEVNNNLIRFAIGGEEIASVTDDGMVINKGAAMMDIIHVSQINSLHVADPDKSNTLGLNYGSSDGKASNTLIGDGRGHKLLEVDGINKTINHYGNTVFSRGNEDFLNNVMLMDDDGASSRAFIMWKLNKGDTLGFIGAAYQPGGDGFFRMNTPVHTMSIMAGANTMIISGNAIDLRGYIFENGVQLSSKYAATANGFRQFISKTCTAKDLRDQIGAASASDILAGGAAISQGLSQFITDEVTEAMLRGQIGAAAESEVAKKADGFTQFIEAGFTASELRRQIGVVSDTDGATINGGLSQFITQDNSAEKLREDIGAGSADDLQELDGEFRKFTKLNDWVDSTSDSSSVRLLWMGHQVFLYFEDFNTLSMKDNDVRYVEYPAGAVPLPLVKTTFNAITDKCRCVKITVDPADNARIKLTMAPANGVTVTNSEKLNTIFSYPVQHK